MLDPLTRGRPAAFLRLEGGSHGVNPFSPSADPGGDTPRASALARTTGLRFGIVGVAIFVIALVLNFSTPFIADDYTFANVFGTSTRLRSVADILLSQRNFYLQWSGRGQGLFFEQLSVLAGKPVFNVLNSVAFLLLVLLIYFSANGHRPIRVSLVLGIPLMLWFALPSFGQSVLWASGATNYLWMAVFTLAALLPFRLYVERPGAPRDTLLNALVGHPARVGCGCHERECRPCDCRSDGGLLALLQTSRDPIAEMGIHGYGGSGDWGGADALRSRQCRACSRDRG